MIFLLSSFLLFAQMPLLRCESNAIYAPLEIPKAHNVFEFEVNLNLKILQLKQQFLNNSELELDAELPVSCGDWYFNFEQNVRFQECKMPLKNGELAYAMFLQQVQPRRSMQLKFVVPKPDYQSVKFYFTCKI